MTQFKVKVTGPLKFKNCTFEVPKIALFKVYLHCHLQRELANDH